MIHGKNLAQSPEEVNSQYTRATKITQRILNYFRTLMEAIVLSFLEDITCSNVSL